jgi:quinol monooxygenase YgiN
MSVTILLDAQVKPEAVNKMISFLKEILPDTREYEGCQGIEVQQNQEDSSNLVMVEEWESRQLYEKYIGWRTETGVMDKIGSMLSQPPSIRYFDQVDT